MEDFTQTLSLLKGYTNFTNSEIALSKRHIIHHRAGGGNFRRRRRLNRDN